MDKLAAIGLGILVCVVLIVVAIGYVNDTVAKRNQSEAVLVQARAQATATTSVALLPWGTLFVFGAFGFGLLGLAGAMVFAVTRRVKVIERELRTQVICYLPAPGQTRPQIWAGVQQVAQLEAGQQVIVRNGIPARVKSVEESNFFSAEP